MKRRLDLPATSNLRAAYHNGHVLAWVGWHFWCVVTQDVGADGGNIGGIKLKRTDDRYMDKRYMCVNNYVFESHGEVLRASVSLDREWFCKNMYTMNTNDSAVIPPIKVMVHALEKEADDVIRSGRMRWVERDGLGWISQDAHMWPTIAPIKKIRGRLRIHPNKNKIKKEQISN